MTNQSPRETPSLIQALVGWTPRVGGRELATGVLGLGAVLAIVACPFWIAASGAPQGGGAAATGDKTLTGLLTQPRLFINPMSPPYNAQCNGVADDGAAINAALAASAANGGTVMIPAPPPGSPGCRIAETIVVPPGADLVGAQYNLSESTTAANGPSGSVLIADLNVTPAVWVYEPTTGSSTQGGQRVSNLSIARAAGTIPAGTICLLDSSVQTNIDYVNCNGHAIGFEVQNTGVYGIVSFFDHIVTCNITDTDLVNKGYAEWHVTQGRFGCNGTRSKTHNSYVEFTGGPGAPTTQYLSQNQFNDINNPTCWMNFAKLTYQVDEIYVLGNHLEFTGQASSPHYVFCSDSTATSITNLHLTDNTILDNNNTAKFLNFSAATGIGNWHFMNNQWAGFGGGWTLASSPSFPLLFSMTGDIFEVGDVSIVGPSSVYQSNVNIDALFFHNLSISGAFSPSGSVLPGAHIRGQLSGKLTNTATTPVAIDLPGHLTDNSGSLVVAFNGVPAKLSAAISKWSIQGSQLTVNFYFQLSALGGGSGPATMSLPFAVPPNMGGGASSVVCTNMKGIGGPLLLVTNAGTNRATFSYAAPSGYGNLTNLNFLSNAICFGSLSFPI